MLLALVVAASSADGGKYSLVGASAEGKYSLEGSAGGSAAGAIGSSAGGR